MTADPIRVFIGSADRSVLEQHVLQWSILRNTRSPVDFYIMNGTYNRVVRVGGEAVENFLDPWLLRENTGTPFTFFRYAIPRYCGSGRAIYLDSDQLLLTDIEELWRTPLDGVSATMCQAYRKGRWATSVMLFDCSRFALDLPAILKAIEAGLLSLEDLNYLTERFRAIYDLQIRPLPPSWNSFDSYGPSTKLIHFTNLNTQPWRFLSHPAEELWMAHLHGAYTDNYVTDEMIREAIEEEEYRPDLLERARMGLRLSWSERLRRRARAVVENAKFMTPRQYLYNLRVGVQRL
jgi:lipopolysaccharide biosynthesis glycosyltransferase